MVDPGLEVFAGFEVDGVLCRHLESFASSGVAANARRAVVKAEAAKAADLDASVVDQGDGHLFKEGFDGLFDARLRKIGALAGQTVDEFGAGHRYCSLRFLSSPTVEEKGDPAGAG